MGRDVIIACDFNSKEEVMQFLDKFQEEKPFVKIGMELFYAEGPEIVREIKRRGHKIFLDLKLHDIPNTVRKSMAVLSRLDVDMCNVHAGGTKAMMEAALEGLTREDGTRPLLIAVTQLTSTSEEAMRRDLWIEKPIDETVMHYAKNTMEAGLDGVVCSPLRQERFTRYAEQTSSPLHRVFDLQMATLATRSVSPPLQKQRKLAQTTS